MRNTERTQTSFTHPTSTKSVRRQRGNNSRDNSRSRGGGFGNRFTTGRKNFFEHKTVQHRSYESNFDRQFQQASPENSHIQQTRFDGTMLDDLDEFPDLDQVTNSKNNNRQTTTRKTSVPLEVISSKPIKAVTEKRVFIGRENESKQVFRRNSANNEPVIINEVNEKSSNHPRGFSSITKTAKRSDGVRPNRIAAQPTGTVPYGTEYSPRYMIPVMEQPTIPSLFFPGNPIVSPPSIEGYITMPGDSTDDHQESAYYKTCVNDESLPHLEKIRKQMEFYFCNVNLKSDVYLRSHMDEKGYVPISTILSFPRIFRLKTTEDDIFTFTVPGSKLECNNEKTHIRRVEDPEKWTDMGLYTEIMNVFQSYSTHPEFYSWYNKAIEYIRSLPQVEQTASTIPYQSQFYQEQQRFYFDEKTGVIYKNPQPQFICVQQVYLLPFDYATYGQMGMYPTDPSQAVPVLRAPSSIKSLTDSQTQQEFIEVVRSGVPMDEPVESNVQVVSQHSESNVPIVEVANEKRNSEGSHGSGSDVTEIISVYNTRKESRKQKGSRGKAGVKMDRHGSIQQKNVKADVHRDSARRVESGLDSYHHEKNKKSTSKHGALSSHPEASPKIYTLDKSPLNMVESDRLEKEKISLAPVNVMTEKMKVLSINGTFEKDPTTGGGSLTH